MKKRERGLFGGICLLGILVLAACHNNQKRGNEEDNGSQEKNLKEYYKRMTGSIGDQKAILQLVKYQSLISDKEDAQPDRYRGIFIDEVNGMPLAISGYKRKDSMLQLITYDHYNPIDTFRGRFINHVFKGTVTDSAGRHLPFTFEESYPGGSYHWTVATYADSLLFDSSLATGPKVKTDYLTLWPGKDLTGAQKALLIDTLSQAYFGAYKTFSKPEDLLKAVSDSFIQKYKQSTADWKKRDNGSAGPSFNWNAQAHTDMVYNADNTVCLMYTRYAFTGGAHGLQSVFCTVFDLKKGRVLRLSDIFKPGYEQKLQQVLEQKLRDQYDIPGDQPLNGEKGILFDAHLPVSNNFYLTGKGIGFIYNPYEVAPYVVGEIDLYLPFNSINDLLNK